ncbi:hypothetical protein ACHAXS_003255 [Conticribra weissflogii]
MTKNLPPRSSNPPLNRLAFAVLAFILPLPAVSVADDARNFSNCCCCLSSSDLTRENSNSSSSVIITTSVPINNYESMSSSNNNTNNIESNQKLRIQAKQKVELAKYFLHFDIDFFSRQSMILGGYYHNVDGDLTQGERKKCNRASCRDHEYSAEKEHRRDVLEYTKKSLLRELNYVRSLKGERTKEEQKNETLIMKSRSDDDGNDQGEQKQKREEVAEESQYEENINIQAANPSNNINCNGENEDACKPYSGENDLLEHDLDYTGMHHHLDCDSHNNGKKPLYTETMKKQLWQTFRQNTLFPSYPIPYSISMNDSLFSVSYSEDRNKGRGAFAKTFIPKGTLVNAALSGAVFFVNAWDFYRYLAALPSREMACDVMDWVWMQEVIIDSGNRVLCLNMDGEAFFNDGSKEFSNVGKIDKASLVYYAKSDIRQGEEILFDYEYTAWDLFEMNLDL